MITAAELDAAIAANEAAIVDPIARRSLDSLSDDLRRYRRILSRMQPEEARLYFGENWHGPRITDLIADSARHRVPSESTRSRIYEGLIYGEAAE